MIRVFIGWDDREIAAFHTLAHSIQLHASEPVSITALKLEQLPFHNRPRSGSTQFSISRFLVPHLCGYEGHAIFMDCDMLVRADIADLWKHREPIYKLHGPAVKVVKHDHKPKETTKFLGQEQTQYACKNWSSVMLFDNSKCRKLTADYVNTASGLDLHQFAWAETVGEIPKDWNHLVGYDKPQDAKLVHYTTGGPWFPEYWDCEYADEWKAVNSQICLTAQSER